METRKNSKFFVSQKQTVSVKSENFNDKTKLEIVAKELEEFNKLIDGHRKLLLAIGKM